MNGGDNSITGGLILAAVIVGFSYLVTCLIEGNALLGNSRNQGILIY